MDPLKPFTSLLRSTWDRTSRRIDRGARSTPAAAADSNRQLEAASEIEPLHALQVRLRARIGRPATWDANRVRQLYVEVVLAAELGANVEQDPAFVTLVERVSQTLATHPKLGARLDVLLKEVTQAAPNS